MDCTNITNLFCELIYLFFYTIYVFVNKLVSLFWQPELKSLDKEVILITGTGSGIGRQLVLQLVKTSPKTKVICWDINLAENEITVREAKSLGAECIYGFQVDITNRQQISKIGEKIRNEIGTVTVIINNAGICPIPAPFLSQPSALIAKIFEVNVLGQCWILQEFLPDMVKVNHGHIVTIASILGFRPIRDLAAYIGSKCAIHGFIESLKKEIQTYSPHSKSSIHFTTVYPFQVDTNMFGTIKPKVKFPFLFPPTLTADYVATEVIQATCRNQEFLYLPAYVQFPALMGLTLPNEILHEVDDRLLSYQLVKERERLS